MISKRLHPASFSNVNTQLAQIANIAPNFITLENKVANGDFAAGDPPTNWLFQGTTHVSVAGNIETFIALGANGNIFQTFPSVASRKYYVAASVKTDSASVKLLYTDNVSSDMNVFHSGSNAFERLSASGVIANTSASAWVGIADARGSAWTNVQVKCVTLVDLTTVFGAGSEPSKTEMDRLFAIWTSEYVDYQQIIPWTTFLNIKIEYMRDIIAAYHP